MVALGFGPTFALPLFVDPYRWSRWFGWKPEPETDVGLYFGRCLGAIAMASCIQAGRAMRDPRGNAAWFEFAESVGWLLASVHLRGWIEQRQPPIEHVETFGWSGFAIAARQTAPR